MKKALVTLLIASMALGFAACGSTNSESAVPPAAAGEEAASASETPADADIASAKDTLVIALDADPGTFKYDNDMDVAIEARKLFLEGLLLNDGSEYEYQLADSIEEDADGMGLTVHLKEDVMFSTGEALKASDIVWSMQIGRDYYESLYSFVDFDHLNAEDDYTVRVPFNTETYLWRSLFCGYNSVGIYSQKAYEEAQAGGTDFWAKPVSTGPFYIDEWNSGEDIRLKANEYYHEGRPYIHNVIVRIITESSVQLMELQTGGIDVMGGNGTTLESAEADENINIYEIDGTSIHYIGINHRSEIFNDLRVRQAFACLVDRPTVINGALNGVGNIHNSMYSPSGLGYSSLEWPYEYNVERAKELFKEAGVDPAQLTLRMIVNDAGNRPAVAEQLSNMFGAAGVTLQINIYDGATTTDKLMNSPDEFDLYLRSLGGGEGEVLGLYFSDNVVGLMNIDEGGCAGEFAQWQDILEKAMANPDMEARKEAYHEADQMVLDNVFWIPEYVVPVYKYTTNSLKGVVQKGSYLYYHDAYFE